MTFKEWWESLSESDRDVVSQEELKSITGKAWDACKSECIKIAYEVRAKVERYGDPQEDETEKVAYRIEEEI